MFKDFETTKNWIENIKRFGSKLDLSRMTKVLARLGNPEKAYKTIHVAGTNGKGSTASYIKNILVEAGFKVGIYISPYIVKFNERIAIGDTYISDEAVMLYANQLLPIWDEFNDINDTITFFEVLTIICFLYFKDQAVDYGVIEVGLGGTLDATNVIMPEVSVITNISYDHMNVLGNTLESIAMNKLGIVKEGVPLVTSVENKDLYPLFLETTDKMHSPLTIIDF
nr:Mur ligase family protein [Bacillota bacterium]